MDTPKYMVLEGPITRRSGSRGRHTSNHECTIQGVVRRASCGFPILPWMVASPGAGQDITCFGGPKSGHFWVPNREIHHIDPRDLQILGPISPRSGPRSQDPRGSEDPTDQIQGSPLTLQTGFSHETPVWGPPRRSSRWSKPPDLDLWGGRKHPFLDPFWTPFLGPFWANIRVVCDPTSGEVTPQSPICQGGIEGDIRGVSTRCTSSS